MFKKIVYIIIAFLLLTTTTGIVLSEHYCEKMPDSFHVGAIADDPCDHSQEYCDIETITIKVESDFTKTIQKINFDQLVIQSPESGNLLQENVPEKEPVYTFSTYKLPKTQTVLALLQSYLL
ncbi:MAG: hypothetical protein R6U04_04595 [Bacteroidales bacterium]